MPDRRRRRRGTARRTATERARYLAHRLGTMLRDARAARGIRQLDAAVQAGVSQSFWSRLERGTTTAVSLETLAACGVAVGLQLAAFFEQAPGADAPRDIEHLRRQDRVVRMAARGGWTAAPEALLLNDGPRPRSIDVLLLRKATREAAVVEIWDLPLDGGEAMRGLDAKVLATRTRLGPDWRVEGLLVLRGTRRNRALVGELAHLFGARFPASSVRWIRALANPEVRMPPATGLAWTDVAGTQLIAARLGSQRAPRTRA
jgi:transcriptional regulator with XRE-family HTH domain